MVSASGPPGGLYHFWTMLRKAAHLTAAGKEPGGERQEPNLAPQTLAPVTSPVGWGPKPSHFQTASSGRDQAFNSQACGVTAHIRNEKESTRVAATMTTCNEMRFSD